MYSVTLNEISKIYNKDLVAVDKVSFNVDEGELFGLIGPDGAGKTSIFRILTTLLLPDGGNARVCGLDVVKDYKEIRNTIGYMPGRFSLYQDLSIEENLNFFATIFDTTLEENYDQIKDIYQQIEPFKKRRAGKLSGGMKQKLALCCALIHKPSVLFLDEPTTGVDPVSRKEFWEMLKHLKEKGISILVSTPYMDEAILCDKIALIQNGNILSIDPPNKMIENHPEKIFSIESDNIKDLLKIIKQIKEIKDFYIFGDSLHFTLKDEKFVTKKIEEEVSSLSQKEIEVKKVIPNIEDIFIHHLNKKNA